MKLLKLAEQIPIKDFLKLFSCFGLQPARHDTEAIQDFLTALKASLSLGDGGRLLAKSWRTLLVFGPLRELPYQPD